MVRLAVRAEATNARVVLVTPHRAIAVVMVGVLVDNLGVLAVAAVLAVEAVLVTRVVAVAAVLVGQHQYREVP